MSASRPISSQDLVPAAAIAQGVGQRVTFLDHRLGFPPERRGDLGAVVGEHGVGGRFPRDPDRPRDPARLLPRPGVQLLSQGTGEQGIFQADLAIGSRADAVDRAAVGLERFERRLAVDERGNQDLLRLGSGGDGAGAVGRRHHHRPPRAELRRATRWRIADVEAADRQPFSFPGEQTWGRLEVSGDPARLLDLQAGDHGVAPSGEGVNHGGGGPQDVNHHRDSPHQRTSGNQTGQEVDMDRGTTRHRRANLGQTRQRKSVVGMKPTDRGPTATRLNRGLSHDRPRLGSPLSANRCNSRFWRV